MTEETVKFLDPSVGEVVEIPKEDLPDEVIPVLVKEEGREDEEIWLKAIRPVVELAEEEDKNAHVLIGKVHAALSEVGLRRRAQRFVVRAYYLGSYEEVRRVAEEEFVEFE